MIKTEHLGSKTTLKVYENINKHSLFRTHSTEPWCNILQTMLPMEHARKNNAIILISNWREGRINNNKNNNNHSNNNNNNNNKVKNKKNSKMHFTFWFASVNW